MTEPTCNCSCNQDAPLRDNLLAERLGLGDWNNADAAEADQ